MGKTVGYGLKKAEMSSLIWDIWSELNPSVETEHLDSFSSPCVRIGLVLWTRMDLLLRLEFQ